MTEQYGILVQEWMSRDSWSGPEHEGFSLYVSKSTRDAHLAEFVRAERARNPSGETPEYYVTSHGEPYLCEAPKKLYELVKARGIVEISEHEAVFSGTSRNLKAKMDLTEGTYDRLSKPVLTEAKVVQMILMAFTEDTKQSSIEPLIKLANDWNITVETLLRAGLKPTKRTITTKPLRKKSKST